MLSDLPDVEGTKVRILSLPEVSSLVAVLGLHRVHHICAYNTDLGSLAEFSVILDGPH